MGKMIKQIHLPTLSILILMAATRDTYYLNFKKMLAEETNQYGQDHNAKRSQSSLSLIFLFSFSLFFISQSISLCVLFILITSVSFSDSLCFPNLPLSLSLFILSSLLLSLCCPLCSAHSFFLCLFSFYLFLIHQQKNEEIVVYLHNGILLMKYNYMQQYD